MFYVDHLFADITVVCCLTLDTATRLGVGCWSPANALADAQSADYLYLYTTGLQAGQRRDRIVKHLIF